MKYFILLVLLLNAATTAAEFSIHGATFYFVVHAVITLTMVMFFFAHLETQEIGRKLDDMKKRLDNE